MLHAGGVLRHPGMFADVGEAPNTMVEHCIIVASAQQEVQKSAVQEHIRDMAAKRAKYCNLSIEFDGTPQHVFVSSGENRVRLAGHTSTCLYFIHQANIHYIL